MTWEAEYECLSSTLFVSHVVCLAKWDFALRTAFPLFQGRAGAHLFICLFVCLFISYFSCMGYKCSFEENMITTELSITAKS